METNLEQNNKQQKTKKKNKILLGCAIGLGAVSIGLATALGITATSNKQTSNTIETDKISIEASLDGDGAATIQLHGRPKDGVINVELINDASNEINVLLQEPSQLANYKYIVDDSNKVTLKVYFETHPSKTTTSKFYFAVSYFDSNNNPHSANTQMLSLVYDYQNVHSVNVFDRDWSTFKQLPAQEIEPTSLSTIYWNAVKNDPKIFIEDLISVKDSYFANCLYPFKSIGTATYHILYSDVKYEKEGTKNFMSFKIQKRWSYPVFISESQTVTYQMEYTHVPFEIASYEPSDKSTRWLFQNDTPYTIDVSETDWDNSKTRISYLEYYGTESDPGLPGTPTTYSTYQAYSDGLGDNMFICRFTQADHDQWRNALFKSRVGTNNNLPLPMITYLGNCTFGAHTPMTYESTIPGVTFNEHNVKYIKHTIPNVVFQFTVPQSAFGEKTSILVKYTLKNQDGTAIKTNSISVDLADAENMVEFGGDSTALTDTDMAKIQAATSLKLVVEPGE